ncbi:MAG: HD domain-containing protein, partial [Clostridia bacterium]|nr:HD domain-containing protein [Clostridia bacterium]
DARLVAMIRGKDKLSHIKEYIDDTFHSFDKNQPWDFYPTCQYGMHIVQNSGSYIIDGLKAASESLTVKKLLDANSYRSQMVLSLRQTLRECDEDTEEHVLRTQIMGRELGKKLGLTDLEQGYLALLCVLHDVGKVAIPLEILNKPGKLTESEWEIMKSHARKGYTIAKSSPSLAPIADYILSHHERWDGKGYPLGSSGENVPLLSRIISIVDAYDAMTNDRVYRKAMPKLKALEILKECAGTQFDPNIVKVFVEMKWDEALEQTQELDKPVDEYDVSKRSGETTNEHVMPVVNANYTLDDQNYIVSIDETFTYLTGYTMDDVNELHLRQLDLIPEEDRDIYDNQVKEQLKKDNIAIITHRVKKKHGGFMMVICSGQLRFDPVTKRNSSIIRISRIDDILRQVNTNNN